MNFKIDVGNYFGVDHETYLDNLQAHAITNPSDYMNMRAAIIEKVKKENMVTMYNLFYNLLTLGRDSKGNNLVTGGLVPSKQWEDLFVPNMSKQQVSEKALSAVKTMNKLIDDVMNDLIPKNFLKITHDVQRTKAAGDAFGV